jgi:hypothetical protein
MPFNQQTVATFNFALLRAVRCLDCNQDSFGLANPSNSTFGCSCQTAKAASSGFDGLSLLCGLLVLGFLFTRKRNNKTLR